MAYASNESGRFNVYIVAFPDPGGKRQVSSTDSRYPRWRRDGKELFYLTSDDDLMAAEVSVRQETVEIGRIQKLFGGVRSGLYDASADGQKFLVIDDSTTTSRPMTLLQNWTAALHK